jgi:NAD+ kinase
MPVAMTSVLLLGDERKGGTRALVDEFARWLRARVTSVHVVMDHQAPLADVRADVVVVFGGDGSILGAARRMGANQLPTLGVNLGRLGFLTICGPKDARATVEAFLRGELTEERRLLLEVQVRRARGPSEPVLCLNDVVLARAASAGIVTVVAMRPDRELATYVGDGVIVATPVGSTAYSLAAGGPVLSPRLDALVLTPLASHTLTLRPLVVPVDQGLEVVVLDAGGVDACPMVIDGQVHFDLAVGERVQVRRSPHAFRQVTRGPASFSKLLREKFGWSDTPRQRVKDGG